MEFHLDQKKEIFEKVNLEKVSRWQQKHTNLPIMQSVMAKVLDFHNGIFQLLIS